MDLVNESPTGCCLCGAQDGPGLWIVQNLFLCRSHLIEAFGLVEALPLSEHGRVVDDLQAQLLVLRDEAARAAASERQLGALQAELDRLTSATAHYGAERAALESALVEAQQLRAEAEATASGSISVATLRREIAEAITDAWSASSNGRRKEKSASTSTVKERG